MGFSPITDEGTYEKMREKILDEAKRVFRPEFLNRVDDIILFHSLDESQISHIVEIQLDKLSSRLAQQRLNVRLRQILRYLRRDRRQHPLQLA